MELKFKRREMYIIERIYTEYLAFPTVKLLANTFITPNMVTMFNYILALFNVIMLFSGRMNILSALLIQVYLFLDILDGNLARYTNQCSKLGAKLDNYGDRILYNLLIFALGYNRVNLLLVLGVILVHNLHGWLATFYIVPNIRKLKEFKRFGIKKWLIDRGIIFGMDLSMLDLLFSVFIVINNIDICYIIVFALYVFDIFYRIIELKINQKIN